MREMGHSLELRSTSQGVLLEVLVKPKASRNRLMGFHNGRLKLSVTAPPEKGKANAAVLGLLAEALALKFSQLDVISGASSPQKTVRVEAVSAEELVERIRHAVRGSLPLAQND
jgi:uncharacterized protein (TIGR00251 family)